MAPIVHFLCSVLLVRLVCADRAVSATFDAPVVLDAPRRVKLALRRKGQHHTALQAQELNDPPVNALKPTLVQQCLSIPGAIQDGDSVTIPAGKNGDLSVEYGSHQHDITLFRDHGRYIAGHTDLTPGKRRQSMSAEHDSWAAYDRIFHSHFIDRAKDVRTLEVGLGLGSGVFRLTDDNVPVENIHVIDHEARMFDLATKCVGIPLAKENFHEGDAVDVVLQLADSLSADHVGQSSAGLFDFAIYDAFEATCTISLRVKERMEQFSKAMVQLIAPGGVAVFNACDDGTDEKVAQWNLAVTFQDQFQQHGASCVPYERLDDDNRLMVCSMPLHSQEQRAAINGSASDAVVVKE